MSLLAQIQRGRTAKPPRGEIHPVLVVVSVIAVILGLIAFVIGLIFVRFMYRSDSLNRAGGGVN